MICGSQFFLLKSIEEVEALLSRHPQIAKKVSVTGAGHVRECKSTEFVWELRKMGFCKGGRK